MNRLLFLTLLFGACTVYAHIPEDGDAKPLSGKGAADIEANLDLNIDTTAIGDTLVSAGGDIAGGLGQTLTGVGEGLIAGGKGLVKGGGNFVQAIVEFLKKIIEGLVKAILGMLNAITDQIDKAEKALFSQVGIKRIGGFKNVVGQLGTALKDTTTGLVGGLGSVVGGLVDTLKGGPKVEANVELGVGGHGHGGKGHGGKGHGKGGKGGKPEGPPSSLTPDEE